MNTKDYKYISSEIKKADSNKKFYDNLGPEYINDSKFWTGYLNALNLIWLQSKNNYKL